MKKGSIKHASNSYLWAKLVVACKTPMNRRSSILLRRAFRVLKHDFDESERALAAERAVRVSAVGELTGLLQRAEAAEREARELKASVHTRAASAHSSLQ